MRMNSNKIRILTLNVEITPVNLVNEITLSDSRHILKIKRCFISGN